MKLEYIKVLNPEIPEKDYFSIIGKKQVLQYMKNEKALGQEIKEVEKRLWVLRSIERAIESAKEKIALNHLIKANQEYGNSYNEFYDDCQEFNVPNMT